MIGSLQGVIGAVGEDTALIEVGGVGYLVLAPGRTLARLAVGAPAKLFIETQVREDSIRLFGFSSEEERAWFAHLQSIPGVGAKVALAIMDTLTINEIADAIALQDKAAIVRANGVGPKLAARIVQELAGKQGPKGFANVTTGPRLAVANGGADSRSQAVSALVNLGIDQSSASRAVASAAKRFDADIDAPELIRAALKEVSR